MERVSEVTLVIGDVKILEPNGSDLRQPYQPQEVSEAPESIKAPPMAEDRSSKYPELRLGNKYTLRSY